LYTEISGAAWTVGNFTPAGMVGVHTPHLQRYKTVTHQPEVLEITPHQFHSVVESHIMPFSILIFVYIEEKTIRSGDRLETETMESLMATINCLLV
jgi:hypothetical protein